MVSVHYLYFINKDNKVVVAVGSGSGWVGAGLSFQMMKGEGGGGGQNHLVEGIWKSGKIP
jgi:hypothetical protein